MVPLILPGAEMEDTSHLEVKSEVAEEQYRFKNNELLVLLGAGASYDADIPHSGAMLQQLQTRVEEIAEWKFYHNLYYYVASAIRFSDEMKGKKNSQSPYNIERLVATLDEIARHDNHLLYPFIGAWTPRLIEVLGNNFERAADFRKKIVEILRNEWVPIKEMSKISYYSGLFKLKEKYQFPLRIFTLNYDMCVEEVHREEYKNMRLDRGFNESRIWDWRQFDDSNLEQVKDIYLYKLHGSLDWKRNSDSSLTYADNANHIKFEDSALIFGSTFKLQYVDPFLFLAYEFRRWTLESKLILCIGYGFGDEHINGMIGQALKQNKERKVLSVSPVDREKIEDRRKEIVQQLQIEDSRVNQVVIESSGAKDFLNSLSIEKLAKYFSQNRDEF